MKSTILHEFLEQNNVKKQLIYMYEEYFSKHSLGGGNLASKIRKANCDFNNIAFVNNDLADIYSILLGHYLKTSCLDKWKYYFEKIDATDKDFTLHINADLVTNSKQQDIKFSNNNIAKRFSEFFTGEYPKSSYWVIIAILSSCWIIDNNLYQEFQNTDTYKASSTLLMGEEISDIQRCEVYYSIILQNFDNRQNTKQQISSQFKNTSCKAISGPDVSFHLSDKPEVILFGEYYPKENAIINNKIKTAKVSEGSNKYTISTTPRQIEKSLFTKVTKGYSCIEFSYPEEDTDASLENSTDTIEISISSNRKKDFEDREDESDTDKKYKEEYKKIKGLFSPHFKAQKEYLTNAARMIVDEVNHQPLVNYLFQKLKETQQTSYLIEYRELVNSIVKYKKDGQLTVYPPVSTLIEQIHNGIKKYTSDKFFNERDVYEILGELALAATQNSTYHIPLDKFQETNDSFRNKILQQIKKDINNQKFRWITCIDDQHYRFTLKYYRLIFTARKKSEQYNAEFISQNKSIAVICQSILDEMRLRPLQKNDNIDIEDTCESSHTEWKFDSLVVYGTALLLLSPTSIMYHMIDELRKIAQNFSIHNQNRKRQESAINLICNLLCEKHNLLPEYQENMFRDTYGKSIYHFQIAAWHHLSGISEPNMTFSSYTDLVYKSIEKACRLRDDHKYANAAPYYILLKGYIEDNSRCEEYKQFDTSEDSTKYLYDCCKIQSKIWNINQTLSEEEKAQEIINIIKLLRTANEVFRNWINPEKTQYTHHTDLMATDTYPLAWVYGCNMALYALADIEREKHEKSLFERIHLNKASVPFSERDFIETIVLCDYFNRKLSFNYDIEYDSNNCTANNVFLLCGSFRITSIDSIITEISISPNRFTLTKSQKEDYKRWLDNESTGTRYKVLLTRYLLICTDYYDKDTPITLSVDDFEDGFLEYDSISQSDVSELKKIISSNNPNQDKKIKTILKKTHLLQK